MLEVSPAGTNAWSSNFANLPGGPYDMRVLASGIAFDATISINGQPDLTIGGFDHPPIKPKLISFIAENVRSPRRAILFGDFIANFLPHLLFDLLR